MMMMSLQFSGNRFYQLANPPEFKKVLISEATPPEQLQALVLIEQQEREDYPKRAREAKHQFQTQVEADMQRIAAENFGNPNNMMSAFPITGFSILALDGPDLDQFLKEVHRRTQRNLSPYVNLSKRVMMGEDLQKLRFEAPIRDSETLDVPTVLNWARVPEGIGDIRSQQVQDFWQVQMEFLKRAESIDITV